MKVRDYAEKLQPFVYHGVDCNPATSGNATADCPICGKSGKFGISVSTGQFRCVVCETSGNIYNFLEVYHRICFENTSEQQYEELAQNRGLSSTRGLKAYGFARSQLRDEWMIPAYNEKGKIANMFRCFEEVVDGQIKYQPGATPTLKLHPMGTKTLTPEQKHRRITEGPWDGVALYDFLSSHTLRGSRIIRTNDQSQVLLRTQGVWSAPAAGNFQADWLYLLNDCSNDILFDNDYPKIYPPDHALAGKYVLENGMCKRPGYNGELRILELLEESRNCRPESIRYLVWGPGSPSPESPLPNYTPQISTPGHDPNLADGYDVRDAIRDHGMSVLDFLEQRLQVWTRPSRRRSKPSSDSDSGGKIKPISRSSFAEVCEDFDARLHYSKPMRETFAIMLAVVISTELPEDPVWLRVIGPPGSGKTTLAECLSVAREWVCPKSVMTGFVSGFTDPTDREKDVSPLLEMNGKTVVMKDADTLVKSPKRDVIMSQLRDIYDKAIRTSYLTGKGKDYEEINLTFILCGTDALRGLSRDTYLGERFLDCEIMDESIDHNPILRRAQANAQSSFVRYFAANGKDGSDGLPDHEVHSDDNATFLKQSTYGLVKYYKDNFRSLPCPEFTESSNQRILALAGFLSYMRARVEKVRAGNEQDYKPRAEIAGRLVKQFTKLAFCLAIVLGKTLVDDEVMDLCNKVMLDTAKGFQLDITMLLLTHPNGLSTQQIYTELNMSETSARHWIVCMQELKIIHRSTTGNRSGQRGRDLHLWKVQPGIVQLWVQAQGAQVNKNGKQLHISDNAGKALKRVKGIHKVNHP